MSNIPINGAIGPAVPAPVPTTHADLLNVLIAKAAEFGVILGDQEIVYAREKLGEVPQDKIALVAHVVATAPREVLLQMLQEHGPPAPPPASAAPPGPGLPPLAFGGPPAGTPAPVAAPPAAAAPPIAPALAAQFGSPRGAAAPTPAAVRSHDPDPDIPGMVPMISGLYMLTDAAVLASAYTATEDGQEVQRYRQIVGVVAKKRIREGKEPLYEMRLSRPALLADHEGKIVEVNSGTALITGIFAVHMLGSLLSFPNGYATISFRPTHFDHDLAGNKVWHGVVRLLVEDQRDAQNKYIPKLVSPESVFGPGPAPAAPNGAPAHAGAQG